MSPVSLLVVYVYASFRKSCCTVRTESSYACNFATIAEKSESLDPK
jgi:hypothetical protein